MISDWRLQSFFRPLWLLLTFFVFFWFPGFAQEGGGVRRRFVLSLIWGVMKVRCWAHGMSPTPGQPRRHVEYIQRWISCLSSRRPRCCGSCSSVYLSVLHWRDKGGLWLAVRQECPGAAVAPFTNCVLGSRLTGTRERETDRQTDTHTHTHTHT